MKYWQAKQKYFTGQTSKVTFNQLWLNAFKAAKPVWIKLLIADLIYIIVYKAPYWMPMLGTWFPWLEAFKIHPIWLETTPLVKQFSGLSSSLMPLLFGLFVVAPVYLGINLLSLRIVYNKPAKLNFCLRHYLSLYWWLRLVSLVVLAVLILGPISFGIFYLKVKVHITDTQMFGLLYSIGCMILVFAVFWSFALNLIFAAGLSTADALRASWKAVKRNFWKVLGMTILLCLVQSFAYHTIYISDIFLMPPINIAWALLYKSIFGERGLVE